MKPAAHGQLKAVCEVCGDVGYRRLLVCCRDCKCSAAHQYCLDKVVFDASLAYWLCYECLQHVTTESSESSERFTECQKPATLSSSEGGDIPSETESLESYDLQTAPRSDYVLSRTSYLSEAQKKRVMAFIQETQPEITAFVAIMRKSNVQPPGPSLGISKEYAFAHFPHKSTNITLQMPGMSKKWHPIFYKRKESRKNMLMGQWLDFVRDNHVQEGDICLLVLVKHGKRSMFTVYLLHATATHSKGGAGFQRVGTFPSGSSAKMASEVNIMEEPTNEGRASLESDRHESSHESLESKGVRFTVCFGTSSS